MKKLIFLTLIGVIASQFSRAQMTMPDTATLHFITNASIGGLQEVDNGNLAAKKGKSQDVRSFGAMMVTDHTKANAQLLQLAKSKGYQLPPPATGEAVPDLMLTRTSGTEFDKNYVDMMVAGHQHTVYLFQNYAVTGKDPDVKAFAQQTLPTLKQHLAAIKAIAAKMKNVSM